MNNSIPLNLAETDMSRQVFQKWNMFREWILSMFMEYVCKLPCIFPLCKVESLLQAHCIIYSTNVRIENDQLKRNLRKLYNFETNAVLYYMKIKSNVVVTLYYDLSRLLPMGKIDEVVYVVTNALKSKMHKHNCFSFIC